MLPSNECYLHLSLTNAFIILWFFDFVKKRGLTSVTLLQNHNRILRKIKVDKGFRTQAVDMRA